MVIFGSVLLLGLFLYYMDLMSFTVLLLYNGVALLVDVIQQTGAKRSKAK